MCGQHNNLRKKEVTTMLNEKTVNWMKGQIDYLTAKEENEGLVAVEASRLATLAKVAVLEGREDICTDYALKLDIKTAGKATRNRKSK